MTPAAISSTMLALFPEIAKPSAPTMIRLLPIVNWPEVRVRVEFAREGSIVMVAPEVAAAISARKEPGPLSLVLVTVWEYPVKNRLIRPKMITAFFM